MIDSSRHGASRGRVFAALGLALGVSVAARVHAQSSTASPALTVVATPHLGPRRSEVALELRNAGAGALRVRNDLLIEREVGGAWTAAGGGPIDRSQCGTPAWPLASPACR